MKLSWSHKLFLSINQRVGRYPLLDRVMYFCAQWLIFILFTLFGFSALQTWGWAGLVQFFFPPLLLSYLLSFGIGYLWRHERPEREFPMIKQLINPLQSWKSFPSDHAIFVTIIFFYAYMSGASNWLTLILGIGGLCVISARVYAGVHYPRDILGGIAIAACSIFIFFLVWMMLVSSLELTPIGV